MSLTLTVISFKNQPINEISPVSVGPSGGTIGRSNDNSLILPDIEKFVSRHHAAIHFENGDYYLSDTSLSGVFVNGQTTPLNNSTIRLDAGMQLKIGEYEISVSVQEESAADDFDFFIDPPSTQTTTTTASVDEPWAAWEEPVANSLFADNDNYASHDELVSAPPPPASFVSSLNNTSPLASNYIPPQVQATPVAEAIPDNFNFDDFFAGAEPSTNTGPGLQKPSAVDDFDSFFAAALGDLAPEAEPSVGLGHAPTAAPHEVVAELNSPLEPLFSLDKDVPSTDDSDTEALPLATKPIFHNEVARVRPPVEPLFTLDDEDLPNATEPSLFALFADPEADLNTPEPEADTRALFAKSDNHVFSQAASPADTPSLSSTSLFAEPIPTDSLEPVADTTPSNMFAAPPLPTDSHPAAPIPPTPSRPPEANQPSHTPETDGRALAAFMQGLGLPAHTLAVGQQAETLHRVGQMFRKLIDGTVAVLRSRAEFKSECRASMTVIRAADNNPLKFTVATDEVLKQLIDNNTDGFLASTTAIEEAFNDIMGHQLAMQAGIQASLNDLLKSLDPSLIEKQFENGIVLQKKSKCWDKYVETYRNTVEEAVDNFYGDEFVKAYEKQMGLLTGRRNKG